MQPCNSFKCPLCGSTAYEILLDDGEDFEYWVPGKYRLAGCGFCGLISASPIPTLDQLLAAHPDSYHCYTDFRSRITDFLASIIVKQQAKTFRNLIGREGRILDVGCADGKHFDIWERFGGWQLVGIDFKDLAVGHGRERGREIYKSTLETFDYPKESFDLVVMDHLLEHVLDPLQTLAAARRFLKDGRYVVGAVPNTDSWDRVVFGRYWGGYHFPRHVCHFSPKTLAVAFEKAGFKLVGLEHQLSTSLWALSTQNFLQSRRLTRSNTEHGRVVFYPLLLGLFTPLAPLQKLFNRAGVIGFVAQRD